MSPSASQAAVFYRDVARHRKLWAIRDERGFPAPETSSGKRAQPFWSSLSRVKIIIKKVPAYASYEPYEVSWKDFKRQWARELAKDDRLVGVNWSGPKAVGFDMEPKVVCSAVQWAIDNARSDSPKHFDSSTKYNGAVPENSLTDEGTRRGIIRHLAVIWIALWILAAVFWLGVFGAHPIVIILAPIAPIYGSVDFLSHGEFDMGIISLVVSVFMIGSCALSVGKCRWAKAATAFIIVYWLWSFCLLGIGV